MQHSSLSLVLSVVVTLIITTQGENMTDLYEENIGSDDTILSDNATETETELTNIIQDNEDLAAPVDTGRRKGRNNRNLFLR